MQNYVRFFLLLIVLVNGVSCSLRSQKTIAPSLTLAGESTPYFPLSYLSSPLVTTLKMSVQDGQNKFQYIVQLEASNEKFTLVALTDFGSKAFQLSHVEDKVQMDIMPYTQLWNNAKWFYADLQWIFWPISAVHTELESTSLRVTEISDAISKVRKISHSSKTLIEIVYTHRDFFAGPVILKNSERNYIITVDVVTEP